MLVYVKAISSTVTKIVPIGFNALEELSDAELHQYLEELEDNELNSENEEDNLEVNETESAFEDEKHPEELRADIVKEEASCVNKKSGDSCINTKVISEKCDEGSCDQTLNPTSGHQDIDKVTISQENNTVSINENKSFVDNPSENFSTLGSLLEPRSAELKPVDSGVHTKNSEVVLDEVMSNDEAASKSASAINNLVSIDCHQNNRIVSETSDTTRITTQKNNTADYLRNDSSSLDAIYISSLQDSTDNGEDISQINLSKESGLCERNLPDSENNNSEGSSVDNRDVIPKGLTEIEYSEIPSCLVRMPKDGSTINVLGEEERPSRPKYLFLPSKITVESEQDELENSEHSPAAVAVMGPPGETPGMESHAEAKDNVDLLSPNNSDSSVEPLQSPEISPNTSAEDITDLLTPEERTLGKLPPFWVPDADAPNCMLCDARFTVLKRRHHCRACGKVMCSKCCNLKSRLEYMDNSEARVCQPCFATLAKVLMVEQGENNPTPNNPMEYCSTIPPLEQAASVLKQPPPSVLVPVGVLKREGSARSRSDVTKQVIFSDGIRPGGDLTELDGSSEPRLPYRRPGRVLKRVGTPPGPPCASSHSNQRLLPPLDPKTMSYIPADKGLPPLAIFNKGEVKFEDVVDHEKLMSSLSSETEQPAVFTINRNLFVHVKIISLDCCVNRTCWCFSTSGMNCVGQDELVVILECLPDEPTIPKDIFKHINNIYQDASR
ncbi:hypothetical protein L9F63_024811, partial [Diploptera punctata]